jgi:hypothetical protein
MRVVAVALTDNEYDLLVDVVHDVNAALHVELALGNVDGVHPVTVAAWIVDVVRDALGLSPLDEPRV